MFDKEFIEIQNLMVDVSKAIIVYESLAGDKQRLSSLEIIVNKLALVQAYIVQLRYGMLMQHQSAAATNRILINNFMAELKLQLDTLKSLSYSYCELLRTVRAKVIGDIGIA